MTLQEAIAHAGETAGRCGEGSMCARDHEQLAEWLEELQQYKSTGLEPEQAKEISNLLGMSLGSNGIPTWDELSEIIKARRDRRLVVLPCVPALGAYSSNEVFIIVDGEIYTDYVTEAYIGQNSDGDLECLFSTLDGEGFSQRDIGKTVFLTKEEVERVLDMEGK